jgi:hypothetical protein
MNPTEVLRDPEATLSAAWASAVQLFNGCETWEPETFRLELQRRQVPVTDGLMAKLLGAQTITQTHAWAYDHEVLFALALAADGIPADSEALHIPTPEQLVWLITEIRGLTGHALDDDEGFDPDAIDPAIALVLAEAGYVVCPYPLEFAQDALTKRTHDPKLTARVLKTWDTWKHLPEDERVAKAKALPEGEDAVQLHRLTDCLSYALERVARASKLLGLTQQHA